MRSLTICLVLMLFIELSMQCAPMEYNYKESCVRYCLKGKCVSRQISVYKIIRIDGKRTRVFDEYLKCYKCQDRKVVPLNSAKNIKQLQTNRPDGKT